MDQGAAFTGGAANDTFNAVDTSGYNAFSALDNIDGGAGVNIMNVATGVAFTAPAGATVTNIQTLNLTESGSAALVTLDTTSGWSGLTTFNVTNAGTGTPLNQDSCRLKYFY